LKVIGAQKAEMDARAASLEGDYDKVKDENEKLRLEVERLMMELGVFTEAKDAAANSCNTETPEIMKELENLETKVDETQASMDLVKGENDKLRPGIFLREQEGFPPLI